MTNREEINLSLSSTVTFCTRLSLSSMMSLVRFKITHLCLVESFFLAHYSFNGSLVYILMICQFTANSVDPASDLGRSGVFTRSTLFKVYFIGRYICINGLTIFSNGILGLGRFQLFPGRLVTMQLLMLIIPVY